MTEVTPTEIPEVLLITPKRFGDERGWFAETWNQRVLAGTSADTTFVQDNQAFSAQRGTLRGLHFQKAPHAQGKLIRALRGDIFDVAVDIRAGSKTYGQWVGRTLTEKGGEQLWIPRGFAHGYCTLTDNCEVAYKTDGFYAAAAEGGLLWNAPDVGIRWPFVDETLLKPADRNWPALKDLADVEF
jgi:dTDP-4-dehydrorhamnose 3,5-epimerase